MGYTLQRLTWRAGPLFAARGHGTVMATGRCDGQLGFRGHTIQYLRLHHMMQAHHVVLLLLACVFFSLFMRALCLPRIIILCLSSIP